LRRAIRPKLRPDPLKEVLIKNCTVCRQSKPLTDFGNYTASKDGKHYRCKSCDKDAVKGYRRGPRKESYRLKIRDNQRRHKYGISPEEYKQMLDEQNSCCAICDEDLITDLTREQYTHKAVVDHCHITEKVRGILCTRCNQALGLFRDSPEILKNAINYLIKQRN
jgi:Recombination endonuclease VII